MIQKAVYFILIYLLTTPTMLYHGYIPNALGWITEVMAIVFIPVILVCLAVNKKFYAPYHYLVMVSLSLFIVAISFLYNQSEASALILGLRHHFKWLPFFLLPIVYNFTEKDIRKILWLVCAFFIIQAPLSFLQCFVWYVSRSGDDVRGTLGTSAVLSVMLISGIAIVYSLFLTKHIKLRLFITLAGIFLIPTMLNETKGSFILLPLAIIISTLLFGDKNIFHKFKKIISSCMILGIFLFLFINAYRFIYSDRQGADVTELYQREMEGGGYLYYGEEKAMVRIGKGLEIGRLDSIMFAIKNISKDPGTFFFGIGVGNAIPTKLSFLKTGNNEVSMYEPAKTTISNVIWEMGFAGLILYLGLLVIMFKDIFVMRGQRDFVRVFCLGWCSVIGVRLLTLFYINVLYMNAYDQIFWLLSGIVLSKCYQLRTLSTEQQINSGDILYRTHQKVRS